MTESEDRLELIIAHDQLRPFGASITPGFADFVALGDFSDLQATKDEALQLSREHTEGLDTRDGGAVRADEQGHGSL
jgi:hypothetical protein